MHRISFSIISSLLLLLTACITEDDKRTQVEIDTAAAAAITDSANFTSIQWIDSVKTFGSIMEGQKLEVVFRLKNTGKKPLVIQSVTPSCGCTVPQKPEEPVMPGAEASIKAIFDSQGRTGTNHKTLTVMANSLGTQSHVLEFNVDVIAGKEAAKPTTPTPVKTSF